MFQTIKPIDVEYEDIRKLEELIRRRDILGDDIRWVDNPGEIKPEMEAVHEALRREGESFFKKYAAA